MSGMNYPAHQASPLLIRLASRPVASTLLRSTLSGLSTTGSLHNDNSTINESSPTQSIGQPSIETPSVTDTVSADQQPFLSTMPTDDVVDDDTKLALFDSVLDELIPKATIDTVQSNLSSPQSLTLLQTQSPADGVVAPDSFEIADPRRLRDRQVRNNDMTHDASDGMLNPPQADQHDGQGNDAQNNDIVTQSDPLVSMMSQSMPSDQFLTDTLSISPASTSSRSPESIPSGVPTSEVPGLTYIEQEPNNIEIPVEVEGFLERVADHTDKLPQEIVIQGDSIALNQVQPVKQAVIMLPITEMDEKKAKGKNPTWSIAWLVKWSQKIIDQFRGRVVYSQDPTQLVNS